MKITRQQLRRIIEMAMIKPMPADPGIDTLIDVGGEDNIQMADELHSSLTGDEDAYSQKRYNYRHPFMRDKRFTDWIEYQMNMDAEALTPNIFQHVQYSKTYDEFVDKTFNADRFKHSAKVHMENSKERPGGQSPWVEAVEQTFSETGTTPVLDAQLKKIHAKAFRDYWENSREYLGLPL